MSTELDDAFNIYIGTSEKAKFAQVNIVGVSLFCFQRRFEGCGRFFSRFVSSACERLDKRRVDAHVGLDTFRAEKALTQEETHIVTQSTARAY